LAHVVDKGGRLGSRVHGPIANKPHHVGIGDNLDVCWDICLPPPAYNGTSRFQYHRVILMMQEKKPNAGAHLLPKAGATQERTL
jgi:hypothetical protein